jgi:hypothetical protein
LLKSQASQAATVFRLQFGKAFGIGLALFGIAFGYTDFETSPGFVPISDHVRVVPNGNLAA